MSDSHYGRFCLRVCLISILGLLILAVEANAQAPPPPGYRVQCTGGSCRLVPINVRPASGPRFQPLRGIAGRRIFQDRVGIRSARHAHHRAGRLFRRLR